MLYLGDVQMAMGVYAGVSVIEDWTASLEVSVWGWMTRWREFMFAEAVSDDPDLPLRAVGERTRTDQGSDRGRRALACYQTCPQDVGLLGPLVSCQRF